MNRLKKKILSVGLAVCLMLFPVIATAAPQQQGGAEVASITAISEPEIEAIAEINSASEEEMEAVITDNAQILGLKLTDYNLLTDKDPVHKALVGKKFRSKSSIKSAFDRAVRAEMKAEAAAAEVAAVTAVNTADAAGMGDVIADNAQVLGLKLTDYNLLTDKAPVHIALVGKRFRSKSSIKSAFDRAVKAEMKAEAIAAEAAALAAVNTADAAAMGDIITANAQALGLTLTDYNLLTNKDAVHQALVGKRFRSKSYVNSAFNRAVAAEKKVEAVAAEAAAVRAVNNADAAGIGAVITADAQILGLNLKYYNLLINRDSVHQALVGKDFRSKSLIKSAFDKAVSAEKRVEDAAKKIAISKIDRITKGASATGITKQDLIDAGVDAADLIDANMTAYQAAISAAANYALNSTVEIQKMVDDVNKANEEVNSRQRLTTAVKDAKTLIGSKTVGTAAGNVSQADHDIFQAAIDAATAVLNNTKATLAQIEEQITALGSATTAFNNAVIKEPETIYDTEGMTYGPESGIDTVPGNAQITAPGVTLRNLKINGNLEIAASVGSGDVFLNNVTVLGETIVKGGGENSLHIANSNLTGRLVVIREGGKVRIVAEGSTSIPNVALQSGATLESSGTGTGFGQVTVETFTVEMGDSITLDGDFDDVTIEAPGVTVSVPDGQVGNMTLAEGATGSSVNVSGGAVTALTVAPGVSNTSVAMSSGNIGQLNIQAPAQVQVQGGTVASATVASTAANTTMNVGAGATVSAVTLNSRTNVTSSGNIGQLNIQATSQVQVQGGTVGSATVGSNAANTSMSVGAGATVTAVTINGTGTNISGTGSIGTATINANGTTIQQTPTTTTVAATVTDGANVGGTIIPPGTTTGGNTPGGGGDTTPTAKVTSITSMTATGTSIATINPSTKVIAITPVAAAFKQPIIVLDQAATMKLIVHNSGTDYDLGHWSLEASPSSNDIFSVDNAQNLNITNTLLALQAAGISSGDIFNAIDFHALLNVTQGMSDGNKNIVYAKLADILSQAQGTPASTAFYQALNMPDIYAAAGTGSATQTSIHSIIAAAIPAGAGVTADDLLGSSNAANVVNFLADPVKMKTFFSHIAFDQLVDALSISPQKNAIFSAIDFTALFTAVNTLPTINKGYVYLDAASIYQVVIAEDISSDIIDYGMLLELVLSSPNTATMTLTNSNGTTSYSVVKGS